MITRRSLRLLRRDPVSANLATVGAGYAARVALSIVPAVLVARALGPADYGLFALIAAAVAVAAGLADAGLSQAYIQSASPLRQRTASIASLTRVYLTLRLGLGTLVGLAWFGAAVALQPILPVISLEIALASAVCIPAMSLTGALLALLQAEERFGAVALAMTGNAALTLLLAVLLFLTEQLTIASALWALSALTAVFGAAIALWKIRDRAALNLAGRRALARDGSRLLAAGAGFGAANGLQLAGGRAELAIIAALLPVPLLGLYALGESLASKLDLARQALNFVGQPAVARLQTPGDMRRFLGEAAARAVVVAIVVLPFVVAAEPLITLVYGGEFAGAAPIFQALAVVAWLELLVLPALLLALPLRSPWALAAGEATRLVAVVALAWLLVPGLGLAGAVLARALSRGALVAVSLALLARRHRKLVASADASDDLL